MTSIKNVIQVGAGGNLGPTVLNALLGKGFNVSVLSRKDSKSTVPTGVNVITADYSSQEELVSAFKGQDAVVSTVGAPGLPGQTALINAAAAAGVKYFIPSEFGGNISNEKTSQLPVFKAKVQARAVLEEKVAEGKLNYIIINTGPFLDWGLKTGFLGFNKAGKKVTLYDGGSVPFSTTTLPSIGKSVAAVLSNPDKFKNQVLYVNSAVTTQRSLLDHFEKHTGAKWTIEEKSTAEVEQETKAKLAQGDFSTIWRLIHRSIWGEGYGGKFDNVSNEELGVELLSEQDLEELVKGVL